MRPHQRPAPSGIKLKIFNLKNRNGLRIVGVVDQPENTQGLVFVLHGLSGNTKQLHIEAIAEAFREKDFTTVRFDSTNTFGESGGSYENMTVTSYLHDLEDVISWATSQPWYQEPFYLAGHSLGGLIVILYTLQHPERVKAIAPISTVVSGRLTHDAWRKQLGAPFDNWQKTGSVVEESSSRPGLKKRLKWAFMEDLLQYDVLPLIDRLAMPTLLIVGDRDDATPLVHQKFLFEVLPGKKELHVIKSASHTFVKPEHLREVKNIIHQWISRIG